MDNTKRMKDYYDSNRLTIPPLIGIPHFHIGKLANGYNPTKIIDMGGRGNLTYFVNCDVFNANTEKKPRIDATNLPFEENHFDVSVSINVLEHVGSVNNQAKFLSEAKRVAKYATIHFFLFGELAKKIEAYKKICGHKHIHIMPDETIVNEFLNTGFKDVKLYPFMTCKEHLLLMASMPKYKYINRKSTYSFIDQYGDQPFSYILFGEK